MISCSQWGLFAKPQAKFSKAWYDEIRDQKYRDAEYLHGVYQKLNFGAYLP